MLKYNFVECVNPLCFVLSHELDFGQNNNILSFPITFILKSEKLNGSLETGEIRSKTLNLRFYLICQSFHYSFTIFDIPS